MPELFVTGVGVNTAIGLGQQDFCAALMSGRSKFGLLHRAGRQHPLAPDPSAHGTRFLGAELQDSDLVLPVAPALLRTASLSSRVALSTVCEAWNDARLASVDPVRIGLVVGGSNFQQRELVCAQAAAVGRFAYLRPTYGLSFMDTDLCGVCTEALPLRGFAHTVGGASASGQLAVIEALEAVRSGRVDVCIAVGALMDLSCYEAQAFRTLGAMGSDRFADEPEQACRPFDQDRDGFIYGEACAAVVVESAASAARRGVAPYARAAGWCVAVDGNRNPNPSLSGETAVMVGALARADWDPASVDYVNPHGSGSVIGDSTELEALRVAGVTRALLNTTKSMTGHGLSAAGAVEVVATLLQMREKQLHPSCNLNRPIDSGFEFVGVRGGAHQIQKALNLSYGFGGINTALCLQRV